MDILYKSMSHIIFSHPDYTVGTGISPARHFRVRGLYRRYGITPYPKDNRLCVRRAETRDAVLSNDILSPENMPYGT